MGTVGGMQVLIQHYATALSKRFNTTRQAMVGSFREADLSLSIDGPYNHELSIKGIASKGDIKEAVRTGDSKINNLEFNFPHADQAGKVEKMFKAWVLGLFQTLEENMLEILNVPQLDLI